MHRQSQKARAAACVGWVQGLFQDGGAGAKTPSPKSRITLLRDGDGDGVAETKTVFIDGSELAVRHGACRRPTLCRKCRCGDALPLQGQRDPDHRTGHQSCRFAGRSQSSLDQESRRETEDGSKLYVGVGSNSNAAENGLEEEQNRAAILEIDPAAARRASSPPACAIRSAWTGTRRTASCGYAVNERDEIGDHLVPDYMTSVKDGGFYGWPYSYYGQNIDERVEPQNPNWSRRR